jgi:DNA-binding PadR family transcriptional regulator
MPMEFRGMLGGGGWGRGRLRRGEIRPLILATLVTRPMHGYEIIQELEAQSGGRWRPSAGSVYPTLQQLADEGLVTSDEVDGRRTYTLTDEGRAAAAANPVSERWSDRTADDEPDLRKLGMQLIGAVMQVQRLGSAHARSETTRILADARREVYRLLADDEAEPATDDAPSSGD